MENGEERMKDIKFLEEIFPDLIADILLSTSRLSKEENFYYIKQKVSDYKLTYDDLVFFITYLVFIIKGISSAIKPVFEKLGTNGIIELISRKEVE